MTRDQIIKEITDLAYYKSICRNVARHDLADDLYQEFLMALLTYPNLEEVYSKEWFNYFCIRIITNLYNSKTSTFYLKYRQNDHFIKYVKNPQTPEEPANPLAQDKHIVPITGSSLWNDLVTQIVASSVSTDYQDLLNNYLQKATLWWTLVEAVLPLSYKFTNKNVMQKSSDISQPASMPDLEKLKEQFTQNAEYYSERATRHLRANSDKFPLYLQMNGNSLEAIRPIGTSYSTGMYLGKPFDDGKKIPFSELYQGKNGLCEGGNDQ